MRTKLRRLARLGPLVEPYLQRKKEENEKAREKLVSYARGHAIALAVLVLHGKPKLKEPLEVAWARGGSRFPLGNLVHQPITAIRIFERVLEELPGATETEKFQHVFNIAPPWLLEFTHAAMTAQILGLKCPDLSRAPRAGRTATDMVLRWPLLPPGTLQAGGPVRPFKEETLTGEERRELCEEAAELIAEAQSELINEGMMPDPVVSAWVRKNRKNRRQRR